MKEQSKDILRSVRFVLPYMKPVKKVKVIIISSRHAHIYKSPPISKTNNCSSFKDTSNILHDPAQQIDNITPANHIMIVIYR